MKIFDVSVGKIVELNGLQYRRTDVEAGWSHVQLVRVKKCGDNWASAIEGNHPIVPNETEVVVIE